MENINELSKSLTQSFENKKLDLQQKINPTGKLNKRISHRFSEYISIFIDRKFSLFKKIYVLFLKIIFPQILAISLCLIMTFLQAKINKICYLAPKCFCDGDLKIRIYSIFKIIFHYWIMMVYLGYYVIFTNSFLNKLKSLKIIIVNVLVGTVIGIYSISDENESTLPTLFIYCISFGVFFISFSYNIYAQKIKIKEFFRKIWPWLLIIFLFFSNYFLTGYVFMFMKQSLINYYPNQGLYLYKLIFAIYLFIIQNILPSILIRIYFYIKNENYSNLNPIFLVIRMTLSFAISAEISSMIDMDLSQWPLWIHFINYSYFLFVFYTRYNPAKNFALKLFLKMIDYYLYCRFHSKNNNNLNNVNRKDNYEKEECAKISDSKTNRPMNERNYNDLSGSFMMKVSNIFHKSNVSDESKELEEERVFIERIISGYMFEFQFILIPRLLSLNYDRKWLAHHHFVEFYEDCSMGISPDFLINEKTLFFIIGITIFVTIVIFLWMRYKGEALFLYKRQKGSLFFKVYSIFLIHNYFEMVLQDFRH